MRRLLLVRHGPTHAKGMVGWTDLPADLSDTAALARLAAWLPDDASVISSDLRRAVETANAIAGPRHRHPHATALREMHFGDWEMKTWREVSQTDPDRIRSFYETPGDIAPPGGESWNDLHARVDPAIDTLLRHTAGDVVVVCHFGVILSQIQRATGRSAYETFGQKLDNLSISEIHISAEDWQTGVINHIP
ncbi:MAG: histidine phosphatase family protein [Pseudomonadota bacterium]